ncbi:phospholipase A2 inhibitor and Ly6/PLAUR domain-containing protein-like isoform X2 [Rana temporaria]|uniref:phospholipase A2 inhibitor and Ly6/PLAUR domain-containing protein-like isoform X2 n=1 Tax=Rana temporaria TaxID=8407 RepID=UPI001AAD1E79|nr:phospholipase A2 inhibitor and Ly6/PLAUR domain-containing protein-like isoform X2 [Rana temporaria]
MKFILAFLIFSGVIATGNALKCNTCKLVMKGETDCVGELEECDENTYKCATQIEENVIGKDVITTVKKSCFPSDFKDYCDNYFELDSRPKFHISVYSKCCNETDGCNTGPIQMPPRNTTLNGRECPVCFEEGSDKCKSIGMKKCGCNQLQCLTYSGRAARPDEPPKDYAIQGCVTPGACELRLQGLPGSQVLTDGYKCT